MYLSAELISCMYKILSHAHKITVRCTFKIVSRSHKIKKNKTKHPCHHQGSVGLQLVPQYGVPLYLKWYNHGMTPGINIKESLWMCDSCESIIYRSVLIAVRVWVIWPKDTPGQQWRLLHVRYRSHVMVMTVKLVEERQAGHEARNPAVSSVRI